MRIMSDEEKIFEVSMKRNERFQFSIDFGMSNVNLLMDEPEPVGNGMGPDAKNIIAAAMGNCLSASLLYCLEKGRAEVGDIKTDVKGVMRRNEEGRWRIVEFTVDIYPDIEGKFESQFNRCLDIFEDYCTVSQSIQEGIPIKVNVH
jgi:uncharacterized OsmC-like protein